MLDKAYFPVNLRFVWISGIWALSKIITMARAIQRDKYELGPLD